MAANRFPAPPEADNPIVVLRATSEAAEVSFLDELLSAHKAGDVDRAAKCAIAALSERMDRLMVNAMLSIVTNLAHDASSYPPSMKTLLCKATDFGFHDCAYNAANQVMDTAKNTEDFKAAERYFKIAMAFTENPKLQAAAHVNYCPIIRDGLISGSPDWPAAVEIYETAARMGLARAMFNAGNVCSWLASQGDRAYGARAAYWFNYALEYRAARKPLLDMETMDELDAGVFETASLALSSLHIDSQFDGANLEEGIRLAKDLVASGKHEAQHNLGVGYMRRLAKLTAYPQRLPGANWCAVLSQMDWIFRGALRTATVFMGPARTMPMLVDHTSVELNDGTLFPLFVTHDPCLPIFEGIEKLSSVAEALATRHPDGFFLLSRKSLFVQEAQRSYTPIYVYRNGELHRQALWLGASPNLLLQHADEGIDFLDKRFSNWTCALPISVNVLDEGFVVAENAEFDLPWAGVGGPWKMPFLDEGQLLNWHIVLQR